MKYIVLALLLTQQYNSVSSEEDIRTARTRV